MNFLAIVEYPYTTVKTFFKTLEELNSFQPSLNEPKEWHKNTGGGISTTTRLLNRHDYVLKSYEEKINDKGEINIVYTIDWDAKKK